VTWPLKPGAQLFILAFFLYSLTDAWRTIFRGRPALPASSGAEAIAGGAVSTLFLALFFAICWKAGAFSLLLGE
jgi:hypothetical protein